MEFIGDKLLKIANWVTSKIGAGVIKGATITFTEFEALFIIAAMVGIYLTIMGNKKLGAKVSSISFISYLLLKVVLK